MTKVAVSFELDTAKAVLQVLDMSARATEQALLDPRFPLEHRATSRDALAKVKLAIASLTDAVVTPRAARPIVLLVRRAVLDELQALCEATLEQGPSEVPPEAVANIVEACEAFSQALAAVEGGGLVS